MKGHHELCKPDGWPIDGYGPSLALTLATPIILLAQTHASQSAKESKHQDARPPVTKVDLEIAKRASAFLQGLKFSWIV